MFMPKRKNMDYRLIGWLASGLAMLMFAVGSFAQSTVLDNKGYAAPGLGIELSQADASNLGQHVFSDGEGLPSGSGSSEQGAVLYADHCAACHGSIGQGGKAIELVGDRSLLTTDYPDRGIGVYWPFAPTLYEYIHRSMPPDNPASFTPGELYSLVAFLLVLNGLLDENATLDAEALRSIVMPNQSGFITVAE